MSLDTYSHPVNQLLTFGNCLKIKSGTNYIKKFGFTEADIPELIRMSIDKELNWADSDSLEVWAPIHAWRSLGQLRAEAAIEPLISMFDEFEEIDWTSSEMPPIFSNIGAAAIPSLAQYLANPSPDECHRAIAGSCLEAIATQHPELRDECVAVLTKELENFQRNPEDLNAFIINNLLKLNAVESAPAMERAFAANCVNIGVVGDWESAQVELGLKLPETRHKPSKLTLALEDILVESKKKTSAPNSTVGFSSSPKKTGKKSSKKKKRK